MILKLFSVDTFCVYFRGRALETDTRAAALSCRREVEARGTFEKQARKALRDARTTKAKFLRKEQACSTLEGQVRETRQILSEVTRQAETAEQDREEACALNQQLQATLEEQQQQIRSCWFCVVSR